VLTGENTRTAIVRDANAARICAEAELASEIARLARLPSADSSACGSFGSSVASALPSPIAWATRVVAGEIEITRCAGAPEQAKSAHSTSAHPRFAQTPTRSS